MPFMNAFAGRLAWSSGTMGIRAAVLLVVRACALDFPSHFLRDADVAVEQLVDYDANAEFLEISSATGLPLHRYDASFGAHPYDAVVALPGDPAAYRQRGFHFGGADLPAAGPIGYAVDGVPIFPYYDGDGANAVEPPPGGAPADRDGCWGFRDPSSGAYVYRIAPPCLYGDDRGTYGRPAARAPRPGAAVAPGGTAAARARGGPGPGGAGVTLPALAAAPWAPPDDVFAWPEAEVGGAYAVGPRPAARCGLGDERNCTAAAPRPPRPTQDAEAPCEPGTFCVAGARFRCPAGRFGAVPGLAAANCSGAARRVVLPRGRPAPILLPAGRYSAAAGLAAPGEAAECPPGSYCVAGSTAPADCPAGRFGAPASRRRSASPTSPATRASAPRASRARPGAASRALSPAGRRRPRSLAVLADPAAQYPRRPLRRLRRVGLRRGGLGAAAFCPAGSAAPTRVRAGHYTVGAATLERGNASDADADARVAEVACEPGHYCVLGVKTPCPPGSYGASSGLADVACDGPCAPGYYCERGSATPTQNACGSPAVYCPAGSAAPLPVGAGNYSAAATAGYAAARGDAPGVAPSAAAAGTDAAGCAPAALRARLLCAGGVRRPCPAGTYGSTFGETSATCAGLCPPGMFCVEASTEAKPVANGTYCAPPGGCRPCCDARRDDATGLWARHGDAVVGAVRLVANEATPRHLHGAPGEVYDVDGWHQHDRHAPRCERLYCPAGSARPLNVTAGRYAVGGNRTTRSAVADCAGLSSHGATLRLGLDRAPYCPTTLRDEHARDRRAPGVDAGNVGGAGALQGSEATHDADGTADEVGAWAPPEFLGPDRDYQWV
ncbi:hypothetical protein JL720_79 [Aureococcus anophagefferens]|nr:hypothetical protein JL720_79 [Aureococcus anophagefferens]